MSSSRKEEASAHDSIEGSGQERKTARRVEERIRVAVAVRGREYPLLLLRTLPELGRVMAVRGGNRPF